MVTSQPPLTLELSRNHWGSSVLNCRYHRSRWWQLCGQRTPKSSIEWELSIFRHDPVIVTIMWRWVRRTHKERSKLKLGFAYAKSFVSAWLSLPSKKHKTDWLLRFFALFYLHHARIDLRTALNGLSLLRTIISLPLQSVKDSISRH